jgi:uncharacterized protein
MKFQPDEAQGVNVIARHESGRVWVGGVVHDQSLLVPATGAVLPWGAGSFDELGATHFDTLAAMRPELVILGTGHRQRFVAPRLLRALIEARIGVETMDTAAACRTYNVLAAEGRVVLAALLLERAPALACQPRPGESL